MAKIIGLRSSFPTTFDAFINKRALPLTEALDKNIRIDVKPSIKLGDPIPSLPITLTNGKVYPLNKYTHCSLLIIFIRGSWCSYSRLHLAELVSNKEKFDNAGIKMLGITGYKDHEWWHSKEINIPLCVDLEGDIFKAFGIKIDNWIEYAWGRNLPHESVFLFNKQGHLIVNDVRKISSILPGQRFLGSETLLKTFNKSEPN